VPEPVSCFETPDGGAIGVFRFAVISHLMIDHFCRFYFYRLY